MKTIFTDPRLNAAGIGFDRILGILDGAMRSELSGFPAYDLEKVGADGFRVSVALAGYAPGDLSVQVADGVLEVKGEKPASPEGREFLHRGIAARSFERRFQLADHVEVKSASFSNGMLVIDLVREVPEARKPRKVDIAAA